MRIFKEFMKSAAWLWLMGFGLVMINNLASYLVGGRAAKIDILADMFALVVIPLLIIVAVIVAIAVCLLVYFALGLVVKNKVIRGMLVPVVLFLALLSWVLICF